MNSSHDPWPPPSSPPRLSSMYRHRSLISFLVLVATQQVSLGGPMARWVRGNSDPSSMMTDMDLTSQCTLVHDVGMKLSTLSSPLVCRSISLSRSGSTV